MTQDIYIQWIWHEDTELSYFLFFRWRTCCFYKSLCTVTNQSSGSREKCHIFRKQGLN
jgi:hypothetical protein